MPNINPRILIWARETAGLSLQEAAQKLGISESHGVPPADRLAAFEGGTREPTRPLLVRMAKQYRRPLLVFYLAQVPPIGERGEDFRSLPPEYSRSQDALVDALVRDVRARQRIARALLEDDEEVQRLPFVAAMKRHEGAAAVADSIQRTLSFDLQQYRTIGRAVGGFSYVRAQAEKAGIFVLLIGNLGSHHTSIDVEAFRGLALADPIAPFVVINDQDTEEAWSFSLLHELCHIWLGATGVSGANVVSATEQFCNDVAGRLLIPPHETENLQILRGLPFDQLTSRIGEVADRCRVSRSMIAYRAFREGFVSHGEWTRLTSLYRHHWLEARQNQRERGREREGGPDYYVVRRHRLGGALLRLAQRALQEGALVPSKAAKLLGVKAGNVYTVLAETPPPSRAA